MMGTLDGYNKILEVKSHTINGRVVECKKMLKKEEVEKNMQEEKARKLFLGSLPVDITNKDLKEYFQKFGKVINAYTICKPGTSISKGFGYAIFQEIESVNEVLKIKTHYLKGQKISISMFKNKDEQQEYKEKRKKGKEVIPPQQFIETQNYEEQYPSNEPYVEYQDNQGYYQEQDYNEYYEEDYYQPQNLPKSAMPPEMPHNMAPYDQNYGYDDQSQYPVDNNQYYHDQSQQGPPHYQEYGQDQYYPESNQQIGYDQGNQDQYLTQEYWGGEDQYFHGEVNLMMQNGMEDPQNYPVKPKKKKKKKKKKKSKKKILVSEPPQYMMPPFTGDYNQYQEAPYGYPPNFPVQQHNMYPNQPASFIPPLFDQAKPLNINSPNYECKGPQESGPPAKSSNKFEDFAELAGNIEELIGKQAQGVTKIAQKINKNKFPNDNQNFSLF